MPPARRQDTTYPILPLPPRGLSRPRPHRGSSASQRGNRGREEGRWQRAVCHHRQQSPGVGQRLGALCRHWESQGPPRGPGHPALQAAGVQRQKVPGCGAGLFGFFLSSRELLPLVKCHSLVSTCTPPPRTPSCLCLSPPQGGCHLLPGPSSSEELEEEVTFKGRRTDRQTELKSYSPAFRPPPQC